MRFQSLGQIILGLLVVLIAFFAGLQKNIFLGMLGFLSFFVIGVTLIIEGFKRLKG